MSIRYDNKDRERICNRPFDTTELEKELSSLMEKSDQRFWVIRSRFYRPMYWVSDFDGSQVRIVDGWIIKGSWEEVNEHMCKTYSGYKKLLPNDDIDVIPNCPCDGMVLITCYDKETGDCIFEDMFSIHHIGRT